ncbi:MAG: tyrosine-type recombinase/integrase, partial [Acidobacteria bacterium]|nr:tyrosine-type recombinase/integrase [Acidobacteriota bacterium]
MLKSCLRFIILTAVRSGEARGATWSEIDLQAAEWRIPAERMKAGREHRVPLSPAAMDTLERARSLHSPAGWCSRPRRAPVVRCTRRRWRRSCGGCTAGAARCTASARRSATGRASR